MGEAREWLPREAFAPEALGQVLGVFIAAWSERWFAHAKAAVTGVRAAETVCPAAAKSLHVEGRLAAAGLTARGKRALLEAALDVDLSKVPLKVADRQLLDVFASSCVEDLVNTMDAALGAPPCAERAPRLTIGLSLLADEFMVLLIPEHVLVPLVKQKVTRQPAQAAVPQARRLALGRTKLPAHALLGHAEIAINELGGLGVGDVLVLDRLLSAPIELCVEGSTSPVARGRFCRNGNRISLQL